MSQIGLTVLKFDNGQVMNEIDGVVEAIYHYCQRIPLNPPF
ncbi:DUF559 domain-containing protein [Acinetobacter sp. YH01005]|nr:DUF559 domain-containing protein [Acinetobacter sp. YH01005]